MPLKHLTACAVILLFSTCLSAQFTYAESRGNVYSPNLTLTEDGGALMLSTVYCYTPGTTVIEGCTYARQLTRINASGDTLWTNEIFASPLESLQKIFENEDGGFTLFGTSPSSYICGNVAIGAFGWARLQIIRVNDQGEEVSRFLSDNECSLAYQGAVRLGEDRYLLVASYADQLASMFPRTEMRYMIINTAGVVERQLVRNEITHFRNRLLLNANAEIEMIHRSQGSYIRTVIDTSFTVMRTDTSISLNNRPVLTSGPQKRYREKVSTDGTFHLAVEHHYRNIDTAVTHYLRFGPEMQILSEEVFPLRETTELVEDGNGDIWIGADSLAGGENGIRLHKLNRTTGTIQETIAIGLPELHAATGFSFDLGGVDILLVGEYKCCNLPDTIGQGEAFIFNNAPPTSVQTVSAEASLPFHVFPNPTSRWLNFVPNTATTAPANYQLFDALGKRIVQGTTTTEVDLTDLPSGIYTYVLAQGGERIQSGKIVKH